MASSKGRKEENALKQAALQSQTKAETPDPAEQAVREATMNRFNWAQGKNGPIDVRNMPGGGVGMSLFKDAKMARDAGRVGTGLGTLSDGANPNFTAALDKENQLERDLNASGMLEGYVEDTIAGDEGKLLGLGQTGNARNMSLYEMAVQRLMNYQNNKKPSFLKQLALGAAQGAGSMAAAMI